jgi:hypothetical protein
LLHRQHDDCQQCQGLRDVWKQSVHD